ncbi:aspartyl protease family protein [uncultured Flavobacterium sp.]|uniref:retropepsin-like aspartic protease n=1 Tax=uncultured Flavobacterium sp. TaxID=165435 RepID=UPI0030C80AB1
MKTLLFMLSRLILIIFFVFSNITFSQVDSTWFSKRNKIIIPFEFSNNLIILKVKINGTELKLLLDTGAEKNVLFSFEEEEKIVINNAKKIKITGVGNGEPMEATVSSKNQLKIKKYIDNNFSVYILNEEIVDVINKLGIEINGILGYSFFKERLIEINYEKKKIIIHKDRTILNSNKIKKFTTESIEVKDDKPYIKINSASRHNKRELKLLLDTGLSDGLWLFNKNDIFDKNQKFISDVLGVGLSGEIYGKRSRIDKLNLSKFDFNDVLVAYPDSLSFKNIKILEDRDGSLGGEIIKRFNLFLDYKNHNIYIKPNKNINDPFNYNMSGIDVQHDGIEVIKEKITLYNGIYRDDTDFLGENEKLKYNYRFVFQPTYKITHIRENSPAAFVNLKEGDKILSINKKSAYNYTIQKINDLFQSEDGKKIKMEVEREGKIIEVIFYLKKII